MKHIKLYEEFQSQELDPKTKTEYIQKLEKHVSMSDLYQRDLDLWSAIVGGMRPEDIDPEELELGFQLTPEEYQKLLDDYESSTSKEQHVLNHFVRMIKGYGDGPDEDVYYIMEPEEYMETFSGLDPEIIMMIISLGKQQLYFDVEWKDV